MRRVLCVVFGLVVCAVGQSAAGQDAVSAFRVNPEAVYNIDGISRFLDAARGRRVDIAIVGDSNVRFNFESGHEDGMGYAFYEEFGCYATRVDPMGPRGSWNAPTLLSNASLRTARDGGIDGVVDEAPDGLGEMMFPLEVGFPGRYGHLPSANRIPWESTSNSGVQVFPGHPLDVSSALRWHFTHHLFGPESLGEVHPVAESVRSTKVRYSSPMTVSTASPFTGFVDSYLDVPAGERQNDEISFIVVDRYEQLDARGPFFGLWQRVEDRSLMRGVSYSPLLYQGGESARDACEELTGVGTGPAMREWLRQVVRLQNGPAMLMVQIIHGGNDVNDRRGSLGPVGGLESRSAEGHEDNIRCVISRIEQAWAAAGYSRDNLYFLLGPYHPSESRAARYVGYQERYRGLADEFQNIAVIDGALMSSEQEFTRLDWYETPGVAHLTISGYRSWGLATVRTLVEARRVARGCEPDIVRSPVGGEFPIGSRVELAVEVEADLDDPMVFQWRKDGEAISGGERVSGEDTPVLVIDPLRLEDLGSYDVVVTTGRAVSRAAEVRANCFADFNQDGLASVGDILDYLNAWSMQDPRADTNGDLEVLVGDILDFLAFWSDGC